MNHPRPWAALLALALTGCAAPAEPVPPEPDAPPPAVSPAPAPVPEPDPAPAPPPDPLPPPAAEDFVRVADYLPDIGVDLRYATEDNFTGQMIYGFTDAYLRYGTVEKLAQAQKTLAAEGYGLLIWDAFRPTSAQFRLWEVCPDPVYVANPNRGFSSHSRGDTVDLCLTDGDGVPVELPTGFDDFSPRADREYSDVSPAAAANARLLEDAMTAAGFQPYSGEWWHFSDTDDYPVEETFSPE